VDLALPQGEVYMIVSQDPGKSLSDTA
jgi:hypothetical protein